MRLYLSPHNYKLNTNLIILLELHRNRWYSQCLHSYQNFSAGCTESYQFGVTLRFQQCLLNTDTRSAVCQGRSHFIQSENALTKIMFEQKSTGAKCHFPPPKLVTKVLMQIVCYREPLGHLICITPKIISKIIL